MIPMIMGSGRRRTGPSAIYGSNLKAFWRSTDVNAGATNGSAITSLTEQVTSSAFGLASGISGNVWPNYQTNVINGLPVLRFAGSSVLDYVTSVLSGTTDMFVHAVVKANSITSLVVAGGPQPLSGDGFSSNNGACQLAFVAGAPGTWEVGSGVGSTKVSAVNTDSTAFHVVTLTRTSTALQANSDGTNGSSTAGTYPNANVGHVFFGGRYNDTASPLPYNGDVAEVVIGTGSPNITAYRAYTLARYGV